MSSVNTRVVYTSVPTSSTPANERSSKSFWCLVALAVCFFAAVIIAMIFAVIFAVFIYPNQQKYKKSYTNRVNPTTPYVENVTQTVISNNRNSDICSTEYCVEAARFIRKNLNENADPCENFFEFTCGSFLTNTQIPTGKYYASVLDNLENQIIAIILQLLSSSPSSRTIEPKAITNARLLYRACINEFAMEVEGGKTIARFLNSEFGWIPSATGSSWKSPMFDLSTALLKQNQYSTFPFFEIKTTIDQTSISSLRYVIRISPGRRLGSKGDTSDGGVLKTSSQNILRDLSMIKSNYQSEEDDEDTPLSNFETQLNQYLLRVLVGYSSFDVTTTVRDLSSTINTDFDFSNYVRRLYLSANVTLKDDDIVVIHKISNIRSISTLLAKQTPDTLQKYMLVYFVGSQTFHMPAQLRKIFEAPKTDPFSTRDTETRSTGCAKYVANNMKYAVSKLYIDRYHDQHTRRETIEIVENIRSTFIEMITSSAWMDAPSKKRTIEKANAILTKIIYPQYLEENNMMKLESMYNEYQFTSSHIRNFLRLLQMNGKNNLQRLRKSITRHDWINISPMTVGAFYHLPLNDITIPAAILQSPVFHKDAPKYLNYGSLGFIVGHEITHGFDEVRRHIDADGKNYTLWSQRTNAIFDRRSKCIVEQYNDYTIPGIDVQVDGESTREENIADSDGLKKAFYAYQRWSKSHGQREKKLPGFEKYSAEQMFFINFGQFWCSKMTDLYAGILSLFDNHSPGRFRSIGSTSNFDEFDRAFDCKPGQGNSRVNKCGVW